MGIKTSAEISVMASLTRLQKPVNYETLQCWGHTGIQQRNANVHYAVSMQLKWKWTAKHIQCPYVCYSALERICEWNYFMHTLL